MRILKSIINEINFKDTVKYEFESENVVKIYRDSKSYLCRFSVLIVGTELKVLYRGASLKRNTPYDVILKSNLPLSEIDLNNIKNKIHSKIKSCLNN